MSDLKTRLGQRIRRYRVENGWSQEKLAELAACHPTYIGQVERGEKNITVENAARISAALGVPLSRLFELPGESNEKSVPMQCYDLVAAQSTAAQARLFHILSEAVALLTKS